MMTQTTSMCCRCCCLQPNIDWEFKVLTDEMYTLSEQPDGCFKGYQDLNMLMHAKEDASWCGRTCSYCSPGGRATTYNVYAGADGANGELLMTHSKGLTCGQNQVIGFSDKGPIRCPCCCFLPYLDTKDAVGNHLGKSQYECDMCLFVPKFKILNADGSTKYRIRPDVCCLGCCVDIKCCGKTPGGGSARCCRVPFFLRSPEAPFEKLESSNPLSEKAAITDLWAGWAAECCTERDLYSITFPLDATPANRATIVGAAHLIDLTFYEQPQD